LAIQRPIDIDYSIDYHQQSASATWHRPHECTEGTPNALDIIL